MDKALLEATAAALVAPGRGILAADESTGTMNNRLEGVGLTPSEEQRRAYRANLFATAGCESAVSGVILYDETIRQNMDDGTPIPDYLTSRGIIPGIKVDTGTIDLEGCPGEKVTKGIEAEPENGWADLGTRCAEYFAMGARFAKWRAVISIEGTEPFDYPENRAAQEKHEKEVMDNVRAVKEDGALKQEGAEGEEALIATLDTMLQLMEAYGDDYVEWPVKPTMEKPTDACISANAKALARYALICQENGLVPIIEPEVLMDGPHSAWACFQATCLALEATWDECDKLGVHLAGTLLKPNMIMDGKDLPRDSPSPTKTGQYDDQFAAVADWTLGCLTKSVPAEVGGVVFLSGGQSDIEATGHLNKMNDLVTQEPLEDGWSYFTDLVAKYEEDWTELPWQLSYSYGRALQAEALSTWARKGPEASQIAFAHRCRMNSLARSGDWVLEDDQIPLEIRETPEEVEARLLGEDTLWEGHRN